jgi:HlyD family secretion protein
MMRGALSCLFWNRSAGCLWPAFGILAALTMMGCGHESEDTTTKESELHTFRVVKPDYRTIVRVVGQPSFVEAYERTSIYPKVTGYIEKWNVDIGDKVRKGDILATLFVPELVEDRETKHRTVALDEERVEQALKIVEVAKADVEAAKANLAEAAAIVAKYKSDTDRWESEAKRLKREVEHQVVDPQVLLETQNQYRMSFAAWTAALATVQKARAQLASAEATLAKDKVDVEVARRNLRVAESDAKRLDAWVGYLQLIAPYDGVIVARNANTWDFVLPTTGDPTASANAPHLSPSGQSAPIYVVNRTDIVRVFVDIPEGDANYIQIGTKARVQIKGYRDKWIPATVTRTSWALNVKSRTLRAEIDLPNTGSQILPGMYAYGKVIIERSNVWALPVSALTHSGNQTFYWTYENGHAVRTEVQLGVSDSQWIEVTNRQVQPKSPGEESWMPMDGSERVIVGDLSVLSDGVSVRLAD